MDPANAVQLFDNPMDQYGKLLHEMRKALTSEVVDEIVAFVDLKSKQKFDEICNILFERHKKLKALYDECDKGKVKSREEYANLLRQYFGLINPKDALRDLQKALQFKEIANDYGFFIEQFSKREFGHLFLRYTWDEKVFHFLEKGLLIKSNELLEVLSEHAKQIKDHFKLMKNLQESAPLKTAIKIGARVVGHMVAGIFGSLAARGITGALMNDQEKIEESISRVEEKWRRYSEKLIAFINELQERYEHVLLTLYGGTIMRANEDLKTLKLYIAQINLLNFDYRLELMGNEHERILNWLKETIPQIENLFNMGDVKSALIATGRLYRFAQSNPVISRTVFINGQTILYTACLYKLEALLRLATTFRIQEEKLYISFVREIFNQIPLAIDDKHLKEIGTQTLTELLLEFISLCLRNSDFNALVSVFDYIERVTNRINEEGIYHAGEKFSQLFIDASIILAHLVRNNHIEHSFVEKAKYDFLLPISLIKLKIAYMRKEAKDAFLSTVNKNLIASVVLTPLYLFFYLIGFVYRLLFKKKNSKQL